jgi:hypothetical protein
VNSIFLDIFDPHYNILKKAGSILGYRHTEETILKTSGENNHFYGKTHSTEIKMKMSESISIAKGGTIFVYDTQGSLVNTFCSARKAGEYFFCSHTRILRYASSRQLFENE